MCLHLMRQKSDYPEHYDPSVLVPIERRSHRQTIGVTDSLFRGYDTWNAYEVSCLLNHGMPIAAMLQIRYDCRSPYMVESRSFKHYLNGYHQEKRGATRSEGVALLCQTTQEDLSSLLKTEVIVRETVPLSQPDAWQRSFECLETRYVIPITDYRENRALLCCISNPKRHLCRYHSRLLRSRCPHTQQPDWGDLFVALDAATVPTPESLLAYLISFRQENQFHEAVVETIYHRLYTCCVPAELMVLAQYTRRGGIDINPLRYTSEKILPFELGTFARTPRQ